MNDNVEDIELEEMKESLAGQVYGSGDELGNGDAKQEDRELSATQDVENDNGAGNGDSCKDRENTKGKKDKKKEKREYLAYKYSNKKKWDLHEAVILTGSPAFLYCENDQGCSRIGYINKIEEDTRIIKPPHEEHYPYESYDFKNMNEVLSYVERARKETIDSLYSQAKQIALDYNDQKQDKVNLLAIEMISSYFQDRFPTTHYDIVLGGNGSGKSSYGDTFTAVGYRVVNLTDPNAANINRILGVIEIGQCTIVSDETGAIDKHPDLMSILKTGYSARGKTSKINDNSRDPEFFSTYCFKMIISERMPNLRDARGVLDRSFSFTTYKGRPKYDIKETLEPQGNPARKERLDTLNDFRKLMLIYRLLHFKDPIPDVNVGVEGREKELSKPVIQLFYDTKAQKEVESTLQNFVNLRTEKKEITLEPILHPIVSKLVSEEGSEIYVKQIWAAIKETIEGYSDEKKPNEYQTLEYGTIYNNSISNILEHTFGGRPKHRTAGNSFIFDSEELIRVGRAYNLTTKIQTKIVIEKKNGDYEGNEGNEGSTKEPSWSSQVQNVGKSDNPREKTEANAIRKQACPFTEPSEPSYPSGIEQGALDEGFLKWVKQSIYRIGQSDTFGCKNCKVKDDIHGMTRHPCSGLLRKLATRTGKEKGGSEESIV